MVSRLWRSLSVPRAGIVAAMTALAVVASTRPASVQQEDVVTFAAFGDFGKAGPGVLAVSNLVKSWNPDFVITLGDNNYDYGEASTIDANIGQYYAPFIFPYVGAYGPGGTVNRFFPSLGNHDWGDGFRDPAVVQAHYGYFTLPNNERYYDFVWGPVHMIAVDSDYHEPDGIDAASVQAAWVQSRVAASTSPWKIVYFHHPPHSSSHKGPNEYMRWPFRAWGATATLAAHHHAYEAFVIENLPHFVSGLGGNGTAPFSFVAEGSRARYNANLGSTRVTASSSRIVFDFVTTSGEVVDSYIIEAPASPGAPNQLAARPVPTGRIDLFWTDNASDETNFSLERSLDGSFWSEVALLDANTTSYSDEGVAVEPTTYHYRVLALTPQGPTAYSNVVQATTVPPAPSAPTASAEAASTSSIRVTWSPADNSARVYRLVNQSFYLVGDVAAGTSSFVDTARTPATSYSYVVRAYNGAGESPSSEQVSATTGQLGEPTNLVATGLDSTRVGLTWEDRADGEHYYKVLRSTNGTSFGVIAWAAANATSHIDTGRQPTTTYYYRVQAYENGGGLSPLSNIATAVTLAPVTAPTNLTVTGSTSSSISLSWTDTSEGEALFSIQRSSGGSAFATVGTVGANVTAFVDGALAPATSYSYRVQAVEGGGTTSPFSNTVTGNTTAHSDIPSAPAGLTATPTGATKIALAWTDTSSTEDGFRIERSTNGGAFLLLVSVARNATSYTNTNLKEATTYAYRVRAYNAIGTSDPSNEASATTSSSMSAPTGLTAVAPTGTRVELSWQDTTSNESGFKVYRSSDGVAYVLLGSTGANVTTYTNGSPLPGTTYWYYVIAYGTGSAQSPPSNVAVVTTPSVPTPPSNLTATAVSSSRIELTWTDESNDETHFRIDRSTNGVKFTTLTWVGAGTTFYADNGRASGKTYWYRVASHNANGSSTPTGVVSATTP